MQMKLAIVIAAAISVAMISWPAQATPLAAAKQVHSAKEITLVANGCIAGWHWSAALKRCVRN